MTIKIEEFDLMKRLNAVAEEFQAILSAKDAEITRLSTEVDDLRSMECEVSPKAQELEARLEKAKEYFRIQAKEIKQLKEENEALKAKQESALPF